MVIDLFKLENDVVLGITQLENKATILALVHKYYMLVNPSIVQYFSNSDGLPWTIDGSSYYGFHSVQIKCRILDKYREIAKKNIQNFDTLNGVEIMKILKVSFFK